MQCKFGFCLHLTIADNSTVTFFVLTLYKYIQSIRSFGDYGGKGRSLLQVVRQTKNYAPLVTLFIRDGTFTFLAYVQLICIQYRAFLMSDIRTFGMRFIVPYLH